MPKDFERQLHGAEIDKRAPWLSISGMGCTKSVPVQVHFALESMALGHQYLEAPLSADGEQRRWMPCSACTSYVVAVPYSVISTICPECYRACSECGAHVYEHPDGACDAVVTQEYVDDDDDREFVIPVPDHDEYDPFEDGSW